MTPRMRHSLFIVVVLAVLGVALACLWKTGLYQHVSLTDLKEAQTAFAAHHAAQPVMTTLLYFACFTLLTACCLPGAAVLMLVAGASFGLVWGSAVAVMASAVGATLTLLASRHLLRSRIEARYGNMLATVNEGLADGGALYLLSMRLLPVIPFVPLNLLCGLTRLPLPMFFVTSLIGMLPATAVYVNAGVQLGTVGSLGDLLTPNLFGALVLLGLLPLATRAVLTSRGNKLQKKRAKKI